MRDLKMVAERISGNLINMPSAFPTIPREYRSEYAYVGRNEVGLASAMNFPDVVWEHGMFMMVMPKVRCPTYVEMCGFKDELWRETEVVMQVHPAKADYIDIFEYLHFWRHKGASAQDSEIVQRLCAARDKARRIRSVGQGKDMFIHFVTGGVKTVAIFADETGGYPSWDVVCAIKRMYWWDDEAAVQYNVSQKFDLGLNMILLFDAAGVELPPKCLV